MNIRHLVLVSTAALLLTGCNRESVTKEQLALREAAKVSQWPADTGLRQDSGVMELKPSECNSLGGDVDYHEWCPPTRLKCTVGDRAVCIDEMDEIEVPK